jgi:hypothetical protein
MMICKQKLKNLGENVFQCYHESHIDSTQIEPNHLDYGKACNSLNPFYFLFNFLEWGESESTWYVGH